MIELVGAFSPVFTGTVKDGSTVTGGSDALVVNNVTVYYWTESQVANLDVLTTENAIASEEGKLVGTGKYEGVYEGVIATRMFETIYCAMVFETNDGTISTGVVGYSPERYASMNYNKNSNDEEIKAANLAKAMIMYGDAARAYFG